MDEQGGWGWDMRIKIQCPCGSTDVRESEDGNELVCQQCGAVVSSVSIAEIASRIRDDLDNLISTLGG